MSRWAKLDNLDRLFVAWSFLVQILLIVHFAVRKPFFESYTLRYGWVIQALCIPAVVINIILVRGGKNWYFCVGGFLFLIYAAFGYWVDFVAKIPFRNPLQLSIVFPYAFLYLAMVMFYWWPIRRLSRPLWGVYTILYVIATFLSIRSH